MTTQGAATMTNTNPVVTEYGIAEVLDAETGEHRHLPHCGSWYSDRYAQTTDLMGFDAAAAAAQRVAEHAGGEYVVVELRRFRRTNV